MLQNIFIISLSISVVILILLIISPLINKRYSAKWRYFVWLVLAIRLVIPFRAEMPKAPVNIPVTNKTVVLRSEGMPIQIIDDNYDKSGYMNPNSADYAPIIDLSDVLFALWAFGSLSFFTYHIASYIIFKRRIKEYICKFDTQILDNILIDMKIKKKLSLYICDKIVSPIMIGFVNPIVLLPHSDYEEEELKVVLKHELTHYKRHDIWYKLLLIIANSVHFFNPIVYIMVKQANRDLEYSCDDSVIKDSDINFRKKYSFTILKAMQCEKKTTLATYLSGGNNND